MNTPFRYDYVGSFLRPAALKQARTDFQSGAIDAEALKTGRYAISSQSRKPLATTSSPTASFAARHGTSTLCGASTA